MKKALVVFFTVFFLFFLSSPFALAANTTTYTLEGITEFHIPNNLDVITRSTPPDDPVFTKYKLNRDAELAFLEQARLYLEIVIPENLDRIYVQIYDSKSIAEFSAYSDKLDTFFEYMKLAAKSSKTNQVFSDYLPYDHPDAQFIILNGTQELDDGFYHFQEYYTITRSKAISISLRSKRGEIPAAEQTLLQSIVDTASFGTISSKTSPGVSPDNKPAPYPLSSAISDSLGNSAAANPAVPAPTDRHEQNETKAGIAVSEPPSSGGLDTTTTIVLGLIAGIFIIAVIGAIHSHNRHNDKM